MFQVFQKFPLIHVVRLVRVIRLAMLPGWSRSRLFGPSKEGEEEGKGGDDFTPVIHGRRKVENWDQTPQ